MTRLGIRATAISDNQMQRIRAASLGSKDVLFMVSFSGSTKEIIAAGEVAKKGGAQTICLTNFAESPVAELADVRLVTSVHIDPLAAEVVSRVAMDFVMDALFAEMSRLHRNAKRVLEKTFDSTSDRYL